MTNLAILGARGYTARELLKLLAWHPQANVIRATSRDAGGSIAELHPELSGHFDLGVTQFSVDDFVKADVQCVFSCLPHAASAEIVKQLLEQKIKVVDFSADYRLNDWQTFESTYATEHPDRDRVGNVPYGLPELFRDQITDQQLVANPGCFPTSALLPIVPLVSAGLVESNIVVDSKSGVSGAGRSPKPHLHFPECNESVMAYAVGSHRHQPEIEHIVSRATGTETEITFTPHLIPMERGILSTIYLRPVGKVGSPEIAQCLREKYDSEPFVRLRDQPPTTRDVSHSNFCDLYVAENRNRVIIISAIDNLIKGASGAAVQNFNLMFGYPETTGLLPTAR